MRPYVSEIYEKHGKTCLLPMPPKYRELLDCARTLGLKTDADEDDMRRVGYKTLYVPEPDATDSYYIVRRTAEELSELRDVQARAIGSLCDAFDMPFSGISDILFYIRMSKRKENDNGDQD